MSKVKSIYNEEYLPFMIRYGRLTLSLGIIAALVPGIILSFDLVLCLQYQHY